jgi:hypothetical protein
MRRNCDGGHCSLQMLALLVHAWRDLPRRCPQQQQQRIH